ncbi:MAG: HemK2/MTQ2 family protein methyltransferase [Candidatus Micrarchaeota archaeon]
METRFRGLALDVPQDVYPPAEDSFMLAARAAFSKGEVLEVGCGSGIASLACAKANPENEVLGLDINPAAVACACANAAKNGIKNASFIGSDLFSSAPPKKFDAILFNPPYLPTSENERMEGAINHAFDGGEDGREVLGRFLGAFDGFLKPGGALLLVQSSLNGFEETEGALKSMGYSVRVAAEEKFFFERICLLEARKPKV